MTQYLPRTVRFGAPFLLRKLFFFLKKENECNYTNKINEKITGLLKYTLDRYLIKLNDL